MIPTVILVGLLFGRWWAVPLVAVGWPLLLLATSTIEVTEVPTAAAFGIANIAVGILAHKALAWALRTLRQAFSTTAQR
jgi:hypothetical protein